MGLEEAGVSIAELVVVAPVHPVRPRTLSGRDPQNANVAYCMPFLISKSALALKSMQENVEDAWTVESQAAAFGMSRSVSAAKLE